MGTCSQPAAPAAFGGSRRTKGFIHGLDVFLKHCLSLKEQITQYMHSGKWLSVFWQITGVLFWKKKKKSPRKVSPFFLFSLFRKMGFCMSGFSRGSNPLESCLWWSMTWAALSFMVQAAPLGIREDLANTYGGQHTAAGPAWGPLVAGSPWAHREVLAFPCHPSLPRFSRLVSWAKGLCVLSPGGFPLLSCHLSGPHF